MHMWNKGSLIYEWAFKDYCKLKFLINKILNYSHPSLIFTFKNVGPLLEKKQGQSLACRKFIL